jgi:WD40 repeat protein
MDAAAIIDRSAYRADLPFEPGLSQQVARDLAVAGTVLPSEMQIVGEQLQNRRIYSSREYRRQGGKASLVYQHLADAIQASGDSDGSKLVLRSLISDENTRLTLSLAEIARRTQRSLSAVEPVLQHLAHARLVRCLQEDEPWRYELMHEYLIEKINQITGRVMDATQRANRLLRQYLSQAAVEPRTRIPLHQLWFIRRYSEVAWGGQERILWRRSLGLALVKAGLVTILLMAGTLLLAARLSVTEEWEVRRLSDGHTGVVKQAVFSPDGNRLVSVGADSQVLVWSFPKRVPIAKLTMQGAVNTVAFSPDGSQFATAGADKTVTFWDAVSLNKKAVLSGHQAAIYSLAYSPDGSLLASVGSDQRTILWDTTKFARIREWPFGYEYGNTLFVNDHFLLNSHGMGWDTHTGRQVADFRSKIEGAVNFEALSPDGKHIVRVGGGGTVVFWDLSKGKSLSTTHPHQDHAWTAAYSPDGRWVATGADDIILWEAGPRKKLLRLEQTSTVRGLAFSPDSRWLVSSHDDGSILIWDAVEHEKVANLNEHSGSVIAVAISPSGKRLASGSDDRSVIVWDIPAGRKHWVLVGHGTRVTAVAFAPDESWLASCDLAGNCFLWDLRAGGLLRKLKPVTTPNATNTLAISSNGLWAATDHRVFETSTGREAITFETLHPAVLFYGASFSPDNHWLAGASPDTGEVLLYRTSDWKLVEVVNTRPALELPRVVSFSPDSNSLVTGGWRLALAATTTAARSSPWAP